MIGLDGSIVNKKNEDDPYGIAVTKKAGTPSDATPKSVFNLKSEDTRQQQPKVQKPLEATQSAPTRHPKPRGPPADPLFDPEDMEIHDEEPEEPQSKQMSRQPQKPSSSQLLSGIQGMRKTEGGTNPRLGPQFSENNRGKYPS